MLLLRYADDLIILGESEADLAKKLNLLQQYTNNNKLTVNVNETKVVCFRRGGYRQSLSGFDFDGGKIEVVNRFTYLGVTLLRRPCS